MRNLKKIIVFTLILSLVVVGFSACGNSSQPQGGGSSEATAADPIIIKWGHTDTEAVSPHKAGLWLKDWLAKETDGRLVLEMYPNSLLGDDDEILKGILLGTADMYVGMGVVGWVAGEQANITELPFVYDSYEDWYMGTFEKGGLALYNQALQGTGFVCLDFHYFGSRQIAHNKKIIHSIDELNGFKVRVTPTELNLAIWSAWGANPTPVPWGEVYTSLTQGVVDGVCHVLPLIIDARFFEAAPYITLTNHITAPYTLMTSQKFLDSLPPDLYEIFIRGVKEMGDVQRAMEREAEKEYFQILADFGCTVEEAPQVLKDQMRAMAEPIYEIQRAASGADLVNAFLATGGNFRD